MRLKSADRQRLAMALNTAHEARVYRRLEALLLVAEGHSVAEAARRCRVDRSSVHRWLARYTARREAAALADRPRRGRPRRTRALTPQRLAAALARDPRRCGYQATSWTVALLAHHLAVQEGIAISARTLRRRLHEAGYRCPSTGSGAAALRLWAACGSSGPEKRGLVRRLKARWRPGDVLLCIDWTLLRLFPPLRATWALKGTQAAVPISGANAKRVLFGAINLRTAHRVVLIRRQAGQADAQAFLSELRRRYRRAGRLWLLADRASAHTAHRTQALATTLRIHFLWLPKQVPELSPMDQLWRELKRLIAANRQAESIDALAVDAAGWVLALTTRQARRKAGMVSKRFWLRNLLQHFWLPT